MSAAGPNNDVSVFGRAGRILSTVARAATDQAFMLMRTSVYGEQIVQLATSKRDAEAESGELFVVRSPTVGTGLATLAAPTTFADTSPFIIVQNANGANGRQVNLDRIKLVCTAAGTAGTSLNWATKTDQIVRYTSGGSASGSGAVAGTAGLLGPYPFNTAVGAAVDAQVYAGALVAAAENPATRRLLDNGQIRNVIPVANDAYSFVFGSHEELSDAQALNGTLIINRTIPHKPVSIAPGHSFLLYLWLPSQSAASSYEVIVEYRAR